MHTLTRRNILITVSFAQFVKLGEGWWGNRGRRGREGGEGRGVEGIWGSERVGGV